MPLYIRAALKQDACAMASILNEIISIGGTTAHRQPFDEQSVIKDFISPQLGISCFVAIDGSCFLGFQALEWSDPNWPGDNPLPADWAIVATFVDARAHKRGVGRKLFANTAKTAKEAGVCFIDATIRKENKGGQAFYQRIGFKKYRTTVESISKRFSLV
ncbi:MAG: GNAT family N-acetyltransferase [Alphaproteobacteria bacterium]